ncbi:MAG: hypothetical protein BWX88_00833 [Planctomycetes bacterium ADurb.Bin126]|nr:MAG: hypothetical protein BWX88_00833 [Planctomycetes bacterium ADurb.Bin126]
MTHDKPKSSRQGFTLVEMLTVLLILAIILALVVGISKHLMEEAARKQTEATQSVLMNAIVRYKELTRTLPPENNLYPLCAANAPQEVRDLVSRLPKEQFTWDNAAQTATAKDGWGQAMTYKATGGRGGVPVLLSAGPDRKINATATHAENLDNIRSDGH